MEMILPENVPGIQVDKEVSEFNIFVDKLKRTVKIHTEKHIIPCIVTTEHGTQFANRVKCIFNDGSSLDWHWQEYIKGSINRVEPICIMRSKCAENSYSMD